MSGPDEFAQLLRDLRSSNAESQEEAAQTFSVTQATFSRWETGHRYPSTPKIVEIAAHYNTSVDQLLGHTPTDEQLASVWRAGWETRHERGPESESENPYARRSGDTDG